MNINNVDRCLGCMKEKAGQPVCKHCGFNETTAVNPLPCLPLGTKLHNQYVLGRMLGHGGFGITYLAWDSKLDTPMAIKEYWPREHGQRATDGMSFSCYHDSADLFAYGLNKFIEEAHHLARFGEHPGIVTVHNQFEANGLAYMVMQYVEGLDLTHYLQQQPNNRLSPDIAFNLMIPVLDGLRAMHQIDLLHRDISPDNIFVTKTRRIILLDFGAAKDSFSNHSQSQIAIHRPGYSPIEQYQSKGEQGPWTDIYAAAATLYKLITGDTPPNAMDRLAEDRLQSPSQLGFTINPRQEAALLKGLEVRSPNRFQTVAEFQRALEPQPQTKRSKYLGYTICLIALALFTLSAIAGLNWMWYQLNHNVPDSRISELQRQLAEIRHREAEQRRLQEAATRKLQILQRERAALEIAYQTEKELRSQVVTDLQNEQHQRAATQNRLQLAQNKIQDLKLALQRMNGDGDRCQDGLLNAAQIRAQVTNRTAFGTRIRGNSSYNWREYQASDGTAYFQKERNPYIIGKWKIQGNSICWCYGPCTEYTCKRVRAASNCNKFHYEDVNTHRSTGIKYWKEGNHIH